MSLWKIDDVVSYIRRWKNFILLPSRIGFLFLLFVWIKPYKLNDAYEKLSNLHYCISYKQRFSLFILDLFWSSRYITGRLTSDESKKKKQTWLFLGIGQMQFSPNTHVLYEKGGFYIHFVVLWSHLATNQLRFTSGGDMGTKLWGNISRFRTILWGFWIDM